MAHDERRPRTQEDGVGGIMWAETVTREKVQAAMKDVSMAENDLSNKMVHLRKVLGHYMENYSSIDAMASRVEAIAEDLRATSAREEEPS